MYNLFYKNNTTPWTEILVWEIMLLFFSLSIYIHELYQKIISVGFLDLIALEK